MPESPPACGVSQLQCPGCVVETATLTDGTTTINLNNGAWCIGNWDDALGVNTRGEDLLVAGVDFLLPRRRQLDRLEASLQMMFDGNEDHTGTSHAPLDVLEGLEVNRRAFIDAAVVPPTTPVTRTLTLTLVDGATMTADLNCEEFRFARDGLDGIGRGVWRVTLNAIAVTGP
jgi:hypothetical protein